MPIVSVSTVIGEALRHIACCIQKRDAAKYGRMHVVLLAACSAVAPAYNNALVIAPAAATRCNASSSACSLGTVSNSTRQASINRHALLATLLHGSLTDALHEFPRPLHGLLTHTLHERPPQGTVAAVQTASPPPVSDDAPIVVDDPGLQANDGPNRGWVATYVILISLGLLFGLPFLYVMCGGEEIKKRITEAYMTDERKEKVGWRLPSS